MESRLEKCRGVDHFKRWSVEVGELLKEAVDCRPMYFSGGGVTVTGGEPTMQFEPLKEFLRGLKAVGINTAMETNATSPRLPELFQHIDFLMTDLKHYDSKKHCEATGSGNETVIRNIKAAVESGKRIAIRIPLINGFNASDSDISGFTDFLSGLDKELFTVEFLRYHEFGKDKWAKCGLEYKIENGFVSADTVNAFIKAFETEGIKIVRT